MEKPVTSLKEMHKIFNKAIDESVEVAELKTKLNASETKNKITEQEVNKLRTQLAEAKKELDRLRAEFEVASKDVSDVKNVSNKQPIALTNNHSVMALMAGIASKNLK